MGSPKATRLPFFTIVSVCVTVAAEDAADTRIHCSVADGLMRGLSSDLLLLSSWF